MFNNYTLVAVSRSGVVVVRGYEKNNAVFAREVYECLEVANHLLVMEKDKIKYEYSRSTDKKNFISFNQFIH